MCAVPVLLLLCTVFIWPSTAQNCDPLCEDTGHTCTELGCVCPTNNYRRCNTGLHCNPRSGCVDPNDPCRYCTPFENCVGGSCSCGTSGSCPATEVCFNGKCYCGLKQCDKIGGESCVDGECKCGGMKKCDAYEQCEQTSGAYQCTCGANQKVCVADSKCDENKLCKCNEVDLECPETQVCINQTCVNEEDACYDIDKTCALKIASCATSSLFSYMKKYCRKTCGYCDACADDPTLAPNECNRTASLCYDKGYMPLMTQLCSKTCELCEEKCKDVLDDCKDYPTHCLDTDLSIRTFMGKNCRQSCRYCTNSTGCLDVDKEFCEANPIVCYHPTFSALASVECPKTCGKC